jgi:hypothetical protein
MNKTINYYFTRNILHYYSIQRISRVFFYNCRFSLRVNIFCSNRIPRTPCINRDDIFNRNFLSYTTNCALTISSVMTMGEAESRVSLRRQRRSLDRNHTGSLTSIPREISVSLRRTQSITRAGFLRELRYLQACAWDSDIDGSNSDALHAVSSC